MLLDLCIIYQTVTRLIMSKDIIITNEKLNAFKNAINEIGWDTPPLDNNQLKELRKRYSCENGNYQQPKLIEKIHEEIVRTFCDDEGESARALIVRARKSFQLRCIINREDEWLYVKVCEQLFSLFTADDKIKTVSQKPLVNTFELLKDKLRLSNTEINSKPAIVMDSRLAAVSKSILILKDRFNLKYRIEDGDVWVEKPECEKIGCKLAVLMKAYGGVRFLEKMFSCLRDNGRYSANLKRYQFPILTDSLGSRREPTVPWGYLFNLALRFPDRGSAKEGTHQELWSDLILLSTALLSSMNVEPYTPWETEWKSGIGTVRMLSELSLLESNYRIYQVRLDDLPLFVEELFSWIKDYEDDSFDLTYSDWQYLIGILAEYLSSEMPKIVDLKELEGRASKLSPTKFNAAIRLLCHESPPNVSFVSPADYVSVKAFFKPFILTGENQLLIPCSSYCCHALIEAILCYYRTAIKCLDNRLGEPIENFVKNRLIKCNIPVLSGEYTNSDGEDGEIDIAIEFDDLICLIEIKKKSITRKSRSGDAEKLLLDVKESLLDSQYQMLGHEYSLIRDGKLTLKSGEMLHLNSRRIEKISLVLLDYGALQDRTIIRQLLVLFLNSKFGSGKEREGKYKKLNERCEQFSKKYSKLYSLLGSQEKIPFFRSWFLSVPQFLILLDKVNSPSDLKTAIMNLKHVSFKTLDWYFEYEYIQNMEKQNRA